MIRSDDRGRRELRASNRERNGTYVRDGVGLVLQEDQDGNEVNYTRDSLGRITAIETPARGVYAGYVASYKYDDHNRVIGLYDSLDQNAGTVIVGREYIGASGDLSRQTYRGGIQLDVARDGYARLIGLTTEIVSSSTGLFDFDYARDERGFVEYEDRVHDSVGDVYRYDDLQRLDEVVYDSADVVAELGTPGSTIHDRTDGFTFDADGHRQSVVSTPDGGASATETYVVDLDRHHYVEVGGVSRAFDFDGRLTESGDLRYEYDALDNLIGVAEVVSPGVLNQIATFTYDAAGRRISKAVGGDLYEYVYAGAWLIEEYVTPSGGSKIRIGQLYHAGGIDEIVMSRRLDVADLDGDSSVVDEVELLHHHNQLGSTIALSLTDGTVVEEYGYDAYGAPTIKDASGTVVSSVPSGNRFLFTGREYDEETELYHYRSRAYEPATGSFLQEDPLGYADGVNPVAYVGANPLNFVDPFGTSALSDIKEDVQEFLGEYGDILGLLIDALGLTDLLDAISVAIGQDVSSWAVGGFSGTPEKIGWWKRAKLAGSVALRFASGAINIARKILRAFKKAPEIAKAIRAKIRGPQCFVAGTLVAVHLGGVANASLPIEEIDVGMLVPCWEVERSGYPVDPSTEGLLAPDQFSVVTDDWWRIELELCDQEEGGSATLLRPNAWVEWAGLELGGETRLVLPEAHIDCRARVVALSQLDRVPEGQSAGLRCVTGRFARVCTGSGIELTIETGEVIRSTASHPYWSEDRGRWVSAARLEVGEALRLLGGSCVTVEDLVVVSLAGDFVFNFEVHRAHNYFVGSCGVLVHNEHAGTGTIVNERGVKIQIYSNDHGPPHAHVTSKAGETRIGQNGHPLRGDRPLSRQERAVIDANRSTIRSEIGASMRNHRRNNGG
jgi:RHS repeat-associated protein